MNRVFPWSDMVLPFAAKEGFERGLGFRRLQALVEVLALERDAGFELALLASLGVLCLDSTPEALTSDLIARYIEIKSREMI